MRSGLLHAHRRPRPSRDRRASRAAAAAIGERARGSGQRALRALVRRSSDERLARTLGADPALRAIFARMAHAYVPGKADGFTGEVQYDLRRDGELVQWTLALGTTAAQARRGPAAAPALVLKLDVADFVRLAAGELDAGTAILAGRLDLEGDFALATRLGEMLGRPGAH